MFLQPILQLKILELLLNKMKKNFKNRQIREREREISNIPKGIVNKRKSSTNFNFPDTSPQTPPRRSNRREFDDEKLRKKLDMLILWGIHS